MIEVVGLLSTPDPSHTVGVSIYGYEGGVGRAAR